MTALVGRKIAKLRRAQKLTQKELAERAGINVNYLSRIENSNVKAHRKALARIANVLGIRISDLER